MNKLILTFACICLFTNSYAQLLQDKTDFTREDTLRGSITPEREWWDLNYYNLNIKVQPDKKYISGYNIIRYKVLKRALTKVGKSFDLYVERQAIAVFSTISRS